jgi:hypothetical protein
VGVAVTLSYAHITGARGPARCESFVRSYRAAQLKHHMVNGRDSVAPLRFECSRVAEPGKRWCGVKRSKFS